MILGQISYFDCVAFLVFLIPQLLLNVPTIDLLKTGFQALPFLLLQLPYQYASERYFTPQSQRSPYVRQATYFQDLIVRVVRYAFAGIPASIGRVFFSKKVALPFMKFRMWRHGLQEFPVAIREIQLGSKHGESTVKVIWVNHDGTEQGSEKASLTKPDLVVYYCHGGGFSMGSNWFYMEFLLAWVHLLQDAGYTHPAICALEYDLVPDSISPTQLKQTAKGYEHLLSVVEDSSRICVAGDSAGATLILSLLLNMAAETGSKIAGRGLSQAQKPGLATLISPWCTLDTPLHRNTSSDFLEADTLHLYGRQYAGSQYHLNDPILSPGKCTDLSWWSRASPKGGFCITYGSEEVFGPDIQAMISRLRKADIGVSVREEPGSIHAWPVVALFLSDTQAQRQKGLKDLVGMIKRAIEP